VQGRERVPRCYVANRSARGSFGSPCHRNRLGFSNRLRHSSRLSHRRNRLRFSNRFRYHLSSRSGFRPRLRFRFRLSRRFTPALTLVNDPRVVLTPHSGTLDDARTVKSDEQLSACTDAELLEGWGGGEQRCGHMLFDRYYPCLLRFFRSTAGDQLGELVQKTLLGCVEGRARLRDCASFKSYLFGIAHNVLRVEYRRRRRDAIDPDFNLESAFDLAQGPEAAVEMKQQYRLLLRALRRIPLNLQIMLQLRYWDDLGVKEIAEVFNVPEGTAKTSFRKARSLLEEAISKLAESPDAAQSTLDNLDAWAAEMRDQPPGV
jgi:RNA polymerase sigma factor (sigma-70 family)